MLVLKCLEVTNKSIKVCLKDVDFVLFSLVSNVGFCPHNLPCLTQNLQ